MQKIASISLFAFSFWSPKNAYFCSKFLLQNFAFFEKLQKNAPLFSYRKWCIETFNNWLKISYFYCFVLRQKWDKRQSKSPFMKNIIYSLAANYKIAKGSRDRVRESRVRTPSTAQSLTKVSESVIYNGRLLISALKLRQNWDKTRACPENTSVVNP